MRCRWIDLVAEPLQLVWQASQRFLNSEFAVVRYRGTCDATITALADAWQTMILTPVQDLST
jgi:hypothetical protein